MASFSCCSALADVLAGCHTDENQVPYFGILGAVTIVVGGPLVLRTPFIRRQSSGVR